MALPRRASVGMMMCMHAAVIVRGFPAMLVRHGRRNERRLIFQTGSGTTAQRQRSAGGEHTKQVGEAEKPARPDPK